MQRDPNKITNKGHACLILVRMEGTIGEYQYSRQ